MTNFDCLKSVFEPPFSQAIEKIENLVSQGSSSFLLGAGCSKCAGLPITKELTERIIASDKLDGASKKILDAVQTSFKDASRDAHIEDYLSELIDLLAITDRREMRGASRKSIILDKTEYDSSALSTAIKQIKWAISTEINKKVSIEIHSRFIRALHRPRRPGKLNISQCINYIVLNYDTVLEEALAFARIPYSDGMDGGATGWWSPSVFERSDLGARIFKIHGSIKWCELSGDRLPRRIASCIEPEDSEKNLVLIWPATTKYRETQFDPFAQLLEKARTVLRAKNGEQKTLIVCGYSFGDTHINLEIERALIDSEGNLTVVVFTDANELNGQLKDWHNNELISDQILIFGNNGFYHGAEIYETKTSLGWWKFENLTRILEGER